MDTQKIESLAFRIVNDSGGAYTMALAYIGDRLGIFKAMAGAGPLTSTELARKTSLNERYVREWLKAMVASEYLDYDPATTRYVMTPEQAFVISDESSPMFCGGVLHLTAPTVFNTPKVLEAFNNGGGVAYDQLGKDIPEAIERFFKPGYQHQLADVWLAAIPGLKEKLAKGGTIADVGCGCGQSTVALSKAFPKAKIVALDFDASSIERARALAKSEGVKNVEFVVSPAEKLPADHKFDLICTFDCIHDMAAPRSALAAIRAALADDGVYLWGEPNASDNPLENRNPVGRTYQAISPLHCLTVSLAHQGEGLGTIIGENGARALAKSAGFTRFERLSIPNPFNQFFAVRA